MLSDNNIEIENTDWDYINSVPDNKKILTINNIIDRIKETIDIKVLNVNLTKNNVVSKMVDELNNVNLNHKFYDITGSLFESFLSERARGGGTNDLGQYFTPKKIIQLIYTLSNYSCGKTVYDPYCGTAGILSEYFLESTDQMQENEKKEFGKKFLFGTEITGPVSLLAKMNMVLVGDGHTNIETIDSLIKNNKYIKNNTKFDIVATNIPFAPNTPEEKDMEKDYLRLSKTSSSISNFIEHCINRCKPQGRIVLIVGKGFLTENASREFRKKLLEEYNLEGVYLLYDGVFAPYTEVFSCILVINKSTPTKYVDFFSIQNDENIKTLKKYFNGNNRYENGIYRIENKRILETNNIDLRGKKYIQNDANGLRLRDLVNYVDSKDTELKNIPKGLKKLTTPNSIQDGTALCDTKSTKLKKGDGEKYNSFCCKLEKDAIVIAKISNKRVADGRYLGSALVGNDFGNLITKEYHQIIPKNKKDLYYILCYIRSDKFQKVIELASGTGGQQRIEIDDILNEPIDAPTQTKREKAKLALLEIDNALADIEKQKKSITKTKKIIKMFYKN